MKYINRQTRQLIIDTPIHRSITKSTTKDGKTKENIKYIAHIPNEILIFLLEQYAPFDAAAQSDVEYIETMRTGKEKYFLSFYDHPGKDEYVELSVTNEKYVLDDTASVTFKKQAASNSYFFTVSKKVFKQLKDDNNSFSSFRFVFSLDCDSYCFKNSVVDVKLV